MTNVANVDFKAIKKTKGKFINENECIHLSTLFSISVWMRRQTQRFCIAFQCTRVCKIHSRQAFQTTFCRSKAATLRIVNLIREPQGHIASSDHSRHDAAVHLISWRTPIVELKPHSLPFAGNLDSFFSVTFFRSLNERAKPIFLYRFLQLAAVNSFSSFPLIPNLLPSFLPSFQDGQTMSITSIPHVWLIGMAHVWNWKRFTKIEKNPDASGGFTKSKRRF
jgi:hypothetical protein